MSTDDEKIDLSVNFATGACVRISISGFEEYGQVISALRKLGQTDYLLALHDGLRGIDPDDYEDEDWGE